MLAADNESSKSSAASISAASEEGSGEPEFGATDPGKDAAALSSTALISAVSEDGSEEPEFEATGRGKAAAATSSASTDAVSQMLGLSHAVVCMG